MAPSLLGIHHVTALASDPPRNVALYTAGLGQRLVKRTINFDDPTTWHLYYADRIGTPGTVMTFFPHPHARPRVAGRGEVGRTNYAAPAVSLDFWADRLAARGLSIVRHDTVDGPALHFDDHDGTSLGLVACDDPPAVDVPAGDVDRSAALRGFASVTLVVADGAATGRFLTDVLGMGGGDQIGDGVRRFVFGDGGPGRRVDVMDRPDQPRARMGAGSVHHVAFRVADDAAQQAMLAHLESAGVAVTPVQDREYFKSIYFREPGGVIFEVATDPPGFMVDESEAELGASLKLPDWYEPQRAQIERVLPPLEASEVRA
jgi:glyoxalase family protein